MSRKRGRSHHFTRKKRYSKSRSHSTDKFDPPKPVDNADIRSSTQSTILLETRSSLETSAPLDAESTTLQGEGELAMPSVNQTHTSETETEPDTQLLALKEENAKPAKKDTPSASKMSQSVPRHVKRFEIAVLSICSKYQGTGVDEDVLRASIILYNMRHGRILHDVTGLGLEQGVGVHQ